MFAEMVSRIFRLAFDIRGVLLLISIVVFVTLSVVVQSYCGKKQADAWNSAGDLMLRENRLGGGYSQSGMDSRFYRQQEKLTKTLRKDTRRFTAESTT